MRPPTRPLPPAGSGIPSEPHPPPAGSVAAAHRSAFPFLADGELVAAYRGALAAAAPGARGGHGVSGSPPFSPCHNPSLWWHLWSLGKGHEGMDHSA